MSNELSRQASSITSQQNNQMAAWEAKIDLIKQTVANGATNVELELFFHQARRTGLDPLAKQIYFVKRQGKGTIQVGIDGFRLIADRTGAYAGSDEIVYGPLEGKYPSFASVTVYKFVQGMRCPFTATARWAEYYPGDQQGHMWRKMPHTMLGKCAEALALRKAFPADLSGLYITEEMDQAEECTAPAPLEKPAHRATVLPKHETSQPISESSGHEAYGYVPSKWPMPRLFSEKPSESQAKMLVAKAKDRDIPEGDIHPLVKLVVKAYGLEDSKATTKAGVALAIDWMINCSDDSLDAALSDLPDEPEVIDAEITSVTVSEVASAVIAEIAADDPRSALEELCKLRLWPTIDDDPVKVLATYTDVLKHVERKPVEQFTEQEWTDLLDHFQKVAMGDADEPVSFKIWRLAAEVTSQ